MRNTRPFVRNFLIVYNRVAVIFLVQRVIRRAQIFVGQRLAVLRHLVHDLFEFGKLRLTEQRRANHIHIIIQQEFFRFLVALFARGFQKVF